MKTVTLALVMAVALAAIPARAGDDHDFARRAREAREILPLREILDRAETAYPGRMIEAELEREHGKMIYQIKLLTSDGRVLELLYDARTGEMLGAKGERHGGRR